MNGNLDRKPSVDMQRIVEEVKANRLLLDGCPNHDFSIALDRHTKQPLAEDATKLFCDWRCSKCGGWVDGIARIWYNKGKAHAVSIRCPETADKA